MRDFSEAEYADIQGLVRFAHGHLPDSAFLMLRLIDVAVAKRWLADAPVTSARSQEHKPETALQVAFTAAGLKALGLGDAMLNQFSEVFCGGMAGDPNRSRRLGDVGNNAPKHWDWGGNSEQTPDLLLMLYAQTGELENRISSLQDSTFQQAFELQKTLLSTNNSPREPFGFADGISQPELDWQQSISTDEHERDRFANRTALGEFLLGYSNEYGQYTERPLLDSVIEGPHEQLPDAGDQPQFKDLGRNGTYLVFRQLSQDVSGFWQYLDEQAAGNTRERDRLAAAMVGRQRNGEPLMPRTSEPIDGIDRDNDYNHFNYDSDPHGHLCPVGAHVRRSNPRTGDYPVGVNGFITRLLRTLGFCRRYPGDDLVASTRFHRLLRRGRAYGTPLSIEQALQEKPTGSDLRGLHFICLGANISRQFEFVQNAWNMSSKFSGLPTEADPLLGNREPLLNGQTTDHFSLPREGAPAQCLTGIPQFISVRGGAYFFMPGIRALRYLASL